MAQRRDEDDASFDDLVGFDTVPPPPGSEPDVHSARTTVAELPDSFLDSLKADVGTRTSRGSGARPIPREEPDAPAEGLVVTRRARAFELPPDVAPAYIPRPIAAESAPVVGTPATTVDGSPSAHDLARVMVSALEAATPELGASPAPVSAPSALGSTGSTETSSPPTTAADAVDLAAPSDPAHEPLRAPRKLDLRDFLFAAAAVLAITGIALFIWALLRRYLA